MDKTKKRILKQAARLCIAINARNAYEGLIPEEAGLTEEEVDFIYKEAKRISERMAGAHSTNMGTLMQCIQYFERLNTKQS
jgi:hypothetical protein